MADADPKLQSAVPLKTVGVRELRANLSTLLRGVRDGAPLQVVSRGEVLAEIRAPLPTKTEPRQLGRLKGKVWVAPDFDTWPDDILESFERAL